MRSCPPGISLCSHATLVPVGASLQNARHVSLKSEPDNPDPGSADAVAAWCPSHVIALSPSLAHLASGFSSLVGTMAL